MGTIVDNPSTGPEAQGGNTQPAGPPQPTLQQIAQTLMLRNLAMPPVPGAPPGGPQYAVPAGIDMKVLAKVTKAQAKDAKGMLMELAAFASSFDWTTTFGAGSPTAAQTQRAISTALAWNSEQVVTQAWALLVRDNGKLAWSEVLAVMMALKPVLDHLIVSSPDLTRTMPFTAAFLTARNVSATKAATTRKAPATAKAKATRKKAQARKAVAASEAIDASEAVLHPPAAPTSGTGTPPAAPPSGSGTHTP